MQIAQPAGKKHAGLILWLQRLIECLQQSNKQFISSYLQSYLQQSPIVLETKFEKKTEERNSKTNSNFFQIGDEIITTLLTYIILFSIDFCPIADRRRIECIQERYIRMLERYVYSKHPRHLACHTFATCLNAVTCIREMADIKKRRAMNMSRTAVPISD